MMVELKATSKAAWWIKSPSKAALRKQSVGTSFAADFADLFSNVALHGYGKLLAPELTLWEKLIWLGVHATTMCTLLTVLSLIWEQFVAQYIVINLHNSLYPVELVPFPAVSVCSNNRISKQAAEKYAKELSEKDPSNRTAAYFFERIRYFGYLYTSEGTDMREREEMSIFQAFLDNYGTLDNETFYNTRRYLEMLTPSCKDFVVECTLAGVQIECFSKAAFQETLTMYGRCCTFNAENTYAERSFKNRFVNTDLGLKVVLNTSRADDFIPILNMDGYVVIIHDSFEFADMSSGESLEEFLTNSEESFVALRARIFDTVDSLRSFGPRTRQCYFDNEAASSQFLSNKKYKFSNCITRCRITSVLALCRCLPFYMPLNLANQPETVVYCTLQHVPCLQNYNFKWSNVLTQRETLPGLEREMEEALYCPLCMPACADVQHQVSLMALPIDRYRAMLSSEQLQKIGLNASDMSLLRVHFDEPYAKYYRRTVGNTWFEALCTVGNVCSIFLGMSIVAIFEILFFVSKYLYFGGRACINQNSKLQNRGKEQDANDMKLYICP